MEKNSHKNNDILLYRILLEKKNCHEKNYILLYRNLIDRKKNMIFFN